MSPFRFTFLTKGSAHVRMEKDFLAILVCNLRKVDNFWVILQLLPVSHTTQVHIFLF